MVRNILGYAFCQTVPEIPFPTAECDLKIESWICYSRRERHSHFTVLGPIEAALAIATGCEGSSTVIIARPTPGPRKHSMYARRMEDKGGLDFRGLTGKRQFYPVCLPNYLDIRGPE
jgi:hypothetical protein